MANPNRHDEGIDPFAVLEAIADALDGKAWDADSSDRIATILREAGYPIRDVDQPTPPPVTLTCDMVDGCTAPVTHIDCKGFVYCAPHGHARKATQRCRKLRPAELKQLQAGEPLKEY